MKKISNILSNLNPISYLSRITKRNAGIIVGGLLIVFVSCFIFRDKIVFLATAGNNPIAYWKFDEGQGSTTYDGIGNNNGILGTGTAAPTWITEDQCVTGNCLLFDGTNDYVNAGDMSNVDFGAGNFSFTMWVKLNSLTQNRAHFIAKDDNEGGSRQFDLLWDSGNNNGNDIRLDYFKSGDTDVYGRTNLNIITDTNWHHIVAGRNGSSFFFYIDGQSAVVGATSGTHGTMQGTTTPVTIGKRMYASFEEPIQGQIDNVRIYNYALSGAQVKADYASRGSSKGVSAVLGDDDQGRKLSNGLMGYWKMDESIGTTGSAWTALDSSGNNNNAVGAGNAGSTVPGVFASAGNFDGVDDWLNLGSSLNMGTIHSAAYWINYQDSGDAVIIGNTASRYITYIDGSASGDSIYYNPDPLAGPVSVIHGGFTSGTWYYITVVRNGTSVSFFKNGVQLGTTQTLTTNLPLYLDCIGGHCNEGISQFEFQGKLDEVRLYNRVLSIDDITSLYKFAPKPKVYYKFDEGSGTANAIDSSGNSYTGTIRGGITSANWVAGKYGNSLLFDGSNDYVETTNNSASAGQSQFTISAWIYPTLIDNADHLIYGECIAGGTCNTRINFRIDSSDNSLIFSGRDNDGGSTTNWVDDSRVISANTWTHVAAVYNSNTDTHKIYVNGSAAVNTTSDLSSIDTGYHNSLVPKIGSEPSAGGSNYFKGMIDDFKIYHYERTASQIIEDMNGSHPAVGTPVGSTVLHLKLDEGYGTITDDWSPQNNDGSLGTGTSAPSWTNDGQFKKALSFDGSSDYLSIPDSPSLDFNNQDFSISGWFYRDTATTDDMIIAKRNGDAAGNQGYMVWIDDVTDKIVVEISDATDEYSITSNSTFTTAGWNYFTFVWDDDSAVNSKIYVNGKDEPNTVSGTIANIDDLSNGNQLHLGDVSDNVSSLNVDFFDGKLDEIKIYPFALSAADVKIDFNQGKSLTLGARSTGLGGTAPDNSATRAYCVPGDSAICSAPSAEWRFDKVSGTTTYDTSTNGNNGNLANGPVQKNGRFGNGLSFDGADDYVDLGDLSFTENASAVTWSFWIKANTWNIDRYYLLKSDLGASDIGWIINHATGTLGRIVITIPTFASDGGTAGFADNVFTGSNWIHISVVFDGTLSGNPNRLKLFVNGSPTAMSYTGTIPSTLRATNNNARLGGLGVANYSLNGLMDEVRIYNYARTPAQIAWEYNKGAATGYYKFNECQGTVANDWAPNSSGGVNGNNGTISIGAGGSQTSAGTCTSGNSAQAWNNGATGKYNGSLNFDNSDDYVTVPDNSLFDFPEGTDFSISAWVKPASLTDDNGIFAKKTGNAAGAAGYMTYVNNQGKIATYISDGTDQINKISNDAISAGSWSHIVVVYKDNTSLNMYINGKDAGGTISGTIASVDDVTNSVAFAIAAESDRDMVMNGQIDEVKLFNYALTSAQIKTDMGNGAVRFQ